MPERIRFERELADLGLREREGAGRARQVMIGEKISLDLDRDVPSLAGARLEKIRWIIPGTAVASYWGDRRRSKRIDLAPRDLERRSVQFHWLDPGGARLVQCIVHRNIGGFSIPSFHAFAFDVKAPKVERFTATTSEPVIVFERGTWQLRFGGFAKKPRKVAGKWVRDKFAGIQWDWTIRMPPGHGGFIKDLQTVRHGRRKVQLLAKGRRATRTLVYRHPGMGPHDQLDQFPRDEGDEASYSSKGYYIPAEFPMKLRGGEAFHDEATFDSPATALDPLDVKVTIDEPFKYHLLCKPDTPGAIWAPLARADWFWSATAVRGRDGRWRLAAKGGKLAKTTAPTTDLPIYLSNTNESEWVTE